jgi:putative membrane protein
MRVFVMQVQGRGKVNWDAATKVVVLAGFALFFAFLIQSGRVRLYVHPRIVPAMIFAILAMAAIALFTLKEVFRPQHKFKVGPYLFFLIPLILAFSFPARSMDSSSMSFGDIHLTRQFADTAAGKSGAADSSSPDDGSGGTGTLSEDNIANIKVTSENFAALAALAHKPDDKGLRVQNNTVVLNDANFYRWLKELYDNMPKYQGKKIQVIGFVFKDKTVRGNEFVPARLLMVCCTADLQTVGMLCRYDKAKALKQDSWVKVTGTIRIIDFRGEQIPIIDAEDVVTTAKPENDYIYPF